MQVGLSKSFAKLSRHGTRIQQRNNQAKRRLENSTPTRFEHFADEWAIAYTAT